MNSYVTVDRVERRPIIFVSFGNNQPKCVNLLQIDWFRLMTIDRIGISNNHLNRYRRIPVDHVYGIIYCTTQELFEFGTSQLSFNETGEKSTNEGRRGIKYIYISQHRAADIGTRKKRSNTTANTVYLLDHFWWDCWQRARKLWRSQLCSNNLV